ncbi:chromate transporter [Paenibacillus phyllosphaerae]|uniref:Chromate transporter n=2 Tax=Paenibacillus phyllosphaerae TaxID=274593 RepID=A0A7W5FNB1_9BACL|nr:chromate transporter [Paenibacillus phyllosphaerae]
MRAGGRTRTLLELFAVSAKLGLTSFGGPIAHLGYFHDEYIVRRKWMDERNYADLVALCQFLPGPASSQVGIGVGIVRAGWLGGLIAWAGFTLPSVVIMTIFALLLQGADIASAGWIHGLKIVAVAVVAHALLGMGQKLAQGRTLATVAVLAATAVLLWPTAYGQVLVIAAAGLAGLWLYRKEQPVAAEPVPIAISRKLAVGCLTLFAILLAGLPLLREIWDAKWLAMLDSFYRAGALVFGGGHVVLPLLEREFVPAWLGGDEFMAGYGAAQAIPGPMFTFASYLGARADGVFGAAIATAGIFLPGFLLVAGALPFWYSLRRSPRIQGILTGVNAAVVGILLAALYDPLWTTAIAAPADCALALILFAMLAYWKLPSWAVVLTGAAGGVLLGWI